MIKKRVYPGDRSNQKRSRLGIPMTALCIVLLAIALLTAGVAAAPLPLSTTQSGTVSGDLYLGSYQNPAWDSQSSTSGAKEFTQSFSIPTFTNVQWARLETVVYAAGTDSRHGQTTVQFDGNGDGTYETTLGVEDQQTASSADAEVYAVNNHMDRCYLDYRIWYDVTSMITAQNPVAYVKTENLDSSTFDGRVKEITLVVAYNDGDSDQVKYWVNTGHDYQASGASGVTTSFDTTSVPAGFTAATLQNVGIASKDALYTFNTLTPTGADPVAPYNYFETYSWDVMSGITAGSASTFGYTNNGGSFKTTIAALTVRGPPPAQPDLVVTAISPNVGTGAFLFANEPNVISVTVKNNGPGASAASTLGVDVAGTAYTASVGTLASGASQTVTVTDTVSRAGSASVTITATADSASVVSESNEVNNVLTSAQTVYNNGYKGKRFTGGSDMNTQAGPFDGHYNVIYSTGNSAYSAEGTGTRTASWTSADLPIPTGATVTSARLYQSSTYSSTGVVPTLTMSFNGNSVTPVGSYTDRKGYSTTYDFPGALYVYDVTSYFNTAGNSISFTPDVSTAFYGGYLVVVYQDPATTVKKIWINDEFDMLYSGASRSITNDEAAVYAPFAGVDITGVASAKAIVIAASADEVKTPISSAFTVNSNTFTTAIGTGYKSTPQIAFTEYDVASYLTSGSNTAKTQSMISGTSGDNMVAMNVILVVEKSATAPVAAFSATPVLGVAPLSVTFTDASTNTPTAWNWESKPSGTSGSWTSFSTVQSPTNSFAAGAYDIRLTATNAGGSNTVTKTQYLSVSAGAKPLTTVTSGTVSGDLYVGAFQPTPYNDQGAGPVRTFTQAYTIPAHTNVQWARLYAVVYAAGTDNRSGQATVSFDGNGDGTYETALGTETLATASTSGAEVYPVNDHVNRQYSDYMIWYDVTSLVNANTVNAQIITDKIGGSTFDGHLKELTLVVAYNDGDSDQVKYWVNEGHDYQTSSGSAVTTTFATSSLTSGWASAELTNVHHSSKDASYLFNTAPYFGANPVSPYASFVKNVFDVNTALTAGSNSNLVYTHAASSSFKTTLATLKVRYATPPTAQFSATPVTGLAPLTVAFTDASTGTVTSYAWDFNNDGTTDSTVQNPTNSYATPGTYTVKLTVTGPGGSDDETKTSYITVSDAPTISVTPATQSFPLATTYDYQIVMNGAPNGLAGYDFVVSLTNTDIAEITTVVYPTWAGTKKTGALPADSVKVSAVDDNNGVSAGATNVLLATITIRGDSTGTTPITVSAVNMDADSDGAITPVCSPGGATVASPDLPVADFTGTPTSGLAPLNVQFTGASTGSITSYAWDFNNDGTIDSTIQSPSYSYANPGIYTVKLTVTGPGGSNSKIRTDYISANSNGPVAGFSATPTSGDYPLTVTFTDASTGATSYAWDFNDDGLTDSLLKNPTYIYETQGTYSVKLIATGPGGSDEELKTGYISIGANAPVANFIGVPTSGTSPLTVQFTDQSKGAGPLTYAWDFNNDGTTDSTVQNPSNTYSAAGTYSVKLTVTGPGGSNSKTRTNYITATGLTADFSANHITGVASRNVSLPVSFTDLSTGSPNGATSWSWKFGDGNTSTLQNPSNQYKGRLGKFTVSLDASNAADHASKTKVGYITLTPYLETFPGVANLPTDLNGDYVYEDINGNGRLDYNDVVTYYQNMAWMQGNTRVDFENYDYNFNGRVDYTDIVILYWMIINR